MKENERRTREEANKDREILRKRVESDKLVREQSGSFGLRITRRG